MLNRGASVASKTADMGAGTQAGLSRGNLDVKQAIGINKDVNNITGWSGATPAGVPNVNVDKAYNWSKIAKQAIGSTTPGSDLDELKMGVLKNIAKIATRDDLGLPRGFKLSDKQIADIYNDWEAAHQGASGSAGVLSKAFGNGGTADIADKIRKIAGVAAKYRNLSPSEIELLNSQPDNPLPAIGKSLTGLAKKISNK